MFSEFDEFADPMRLPINGKIYEIPPVGAEDGMRLTALIEADAKLADEELRRILLGDMGDRLLKEVTFATYGRVLMVALTEFRAGRAAAELLWETNGDPKALEALKTREGVANTTPAQGSGSGTRTRKTPAATPSRTAKRSSTGG